MGNAGSTGSTGNTGNTGNMGSTGSTGDMGNTGNTGNTVADPNDTPREDLLQGTLDLLILRAVQAGPLHGWAISQRIAQVSNDVLLVQQGSLYPSLHRLERRGWIAAEWGESENRRRAKFYSLTAEGQAQLKLETERWHRLADAVGRVLQHA
jgi:PadR family transcriptional regulator